jgi:Cysteine rich repeat
MAIAMRSVRDVVALANFPRPYDRAPLAGPGAAQTPAQDVTAAMQGQLGDQLLEGCSTELAQHCAEVTPGEGALLACLYAHGDKLSGQCDYALYNAAARLERAISAITYVVSECRGELERHCAVEAHQMTAEGLRPLGRGQIRSEGGELPGMVLPTAVLAATASPIGLIVGGTAKATGEVTGSETIQGAAKRTADEIAAQVRMAAEQQGWI